MNMNEGIVNVTLTKACNIKPVKDSTESKQITLAVKYDGLTIGDVFTKALRSDVISWQNGPGRKGYANLVNKSTVNISAKAPGAITIDPETAMVAKLVTMTLDEQKAEFARMIKLAKKAAGVTSKPTMVVKEGVTSEDIQDLTEKVEKAVSFIETE